ncbi:FRG domain-containing protein [Pedobacter arcticus]|uniref:FRG domain-containing protein n=1 Tax=Pedobacter arcticus TaxID=752140 RepID=UPI0002E91A51|nr:FRG domain-containing protein [Pedobacter arcticus]
MQKVKSVSEYIETIVNTEKKSITDDDETNVFWFRGESSINYKTPLVPNAYRVIAESINLSTNKQFMSKNIQSIEGNINSDYYRKAVFYLKENNIENTRANRYFLMQHYGLLTRLLDWTENALIALYFATNSAGNSLDARVWMLNPFELNNYTMQQLFSNRETKEYKLIPGIANTYKKKKLFNKKNQLRLTELTRRYLYMDFLTNDGDIESEEAYFPLAVYPPYIDRRIQSQSGCFTIFGNQITGLTCAKKDWLKSIIIDGNKKNEILKELEIIGISEHSIYPDLDGLSRSIKQKYLKGYYDNRELIIHMLKNSGGSKYDIKQFNSIDLLTKIR